MSNKWTATACFLIALAIIMGAFGAHGLKEVLDQYSRDVYEKAVFYHVVNALGLFVVSLLPSLSKLSSKQTNVVCYLLLFGIIIFSGSLYILAVTGIKWLGAVTPIGGVAFIIAWCVAGLGLAKQ